MSDTDVARAARELERELLRQGKTVAAWASETLARAPGAWVKWCDTIPVLLDKKDRSRRAIVRLDQEDLEERRPELLEAWGRGDLDAVEREVCAELDRRQALPGRRVVAIWWRGAWQQLEAVVWHPGLGEARPGEELPVWDFDRERRS